MDDKTIHNNIQLLHEPKTGEILFYTSDEGELKVNVFLQDETMRMSQKQMGELFGVGTNTINYHLSEIFKSQELSEDSVIRNFRITANDGKQYLTKHYNLDAIIAVWYRVNSYQATKFRIRATEYQARNQKIIMKDWIENTKDLLKLNKVRILEGKGSVSKELAEKIYKKYLAYRIHLCI